MSASLLLLLLGILAGTGGVCCGAIAEVAEMISEAGATVIIVLHCLVVCSCRCYGCAAFRLNCSVVSLVSVLPLLPPFPSAPSFPSPSLPSPPDRPSQSFVVGEVVGELLLCALACVLFVCVF